MIPNITAATRVACLSGVGWAVIAWVIGYGFLGQRIWGGILLAPVIGWAIGVMSVNLRERPRGTRVAGALLSIYAAGALFAIALTPTSVCLTRGCPSPIAVVLENLFGVLWGLTFTGWALLLWPVAYFNHTLMWQTADGEMPRPPRVGVTGPSIRRLGLALMAAVACGYVGWTILQFPRLASQSSAAPWWHVTALMWFSEWALIGGFTSALAPMLAVCAARASGVRGVVTTRWIELVGLLGIVLLVFPIVSYVSHLIVVLAKVTLVKSWATEGTVFTAPFYYRNVVRLYSPWILAGVWLICVRAAVDAVSRWRGEGGRPPAL